ncbi:MAG: hypothetical protein RR654_10815 [Oscillospiraceae bacterium]
MKKTFAWLDDELMLLLISAHKELDTLKGLVRFVPNASDLRTLLLKKDACYSLQIDNKGISFYEIMQLTSAKQNRYDTVVNTIRVYEA